MGMFLFHCLDQGVLHTALTIFYWPKSLTEYLQNNFLHMVKHSWMTVVGLADN
jgi:hypothetical protein